jgi:hypothetical protein
MFSVWYALEDGTPTNYNGCNSIQLNFKDMHKVPMLGYQKMAEFQMKGPLRAFTIVTVRDVLTGKQVVLDGNHRLLASMLLKDYVNVTVIALEGTGFPSHPDMKVLQ